MIFILASILILSLSMLVLLALRYYREYLIYKVEHEQTLDPLNQRKLIFFKNKMRNGHFFTLLITSGLTALILLVLIAVQFSYEQELKKVIAQHGQMREELEFLQQEQHSLSQMPIYTYPSEGVSIATIDWENLLVSHTKEEQLSAEQELSSRLSPFLGRTMALIFIDQPMQEVAVTLTSYLTKTSDLSAWEDNYSRLLEELNQISIITQGHFVVRVQEEPSSSFEQTVIRDEEGNWQSLSRKNLVNDEDSTDKQDKEEQIQKNNDETTDSEEQKGSVQWHE